MSHCIMGKQVVDMRDTKKKMHLLSFPFAWKLIHLCNSSSLGSLPQRQFWVAVVTDEVVFSLAPGKPVAHRGVLGIQRGLHFRMLGPGAEFSDTAASDHTWLHSVHSVNYSTCIPPSSGVTASVSERLFDKILGWGKK